MGKSKSTKEREAYRYKQLSETSESAWETVQNEPWFQKYSHDFETNRAIILTLLEDKLALLTPHYIITLKENNKNGKAKN